MNEVVASIGKLATLINIRIRCEGMRCPATDRDKRRSAANEIATHKPKA
ncbi:hypothetical protein [Cupriavidus necator]